jgi:small subunit ribosomal protein S1
MVAIMTQPRHDATPPLAFPPASSAIRHSMNPDGPSSPHDESFSALFQQSSSTPSKARHLSLGDEVEATVVKVGRDAVFVDLDGKREAFIDKQDLLDASEKAVEMPVGARIVARVVELGGKAGAVRLRPLAVRHGQADPAEEGGASEQRVEMLVGSKTTLMVGAHVKGVVTKVESFGVFIQIEGTQGHEGRGLIPMVQTNVAKGSDPRKHFSAGQTVEAKIIAIDEKGRLKLSIRALVDDAEKDEYRQFQQKTAQPTGPQTRGFGTLGDLLAGGSKGKKRR